jgi:hypothetical protein
MTNKYKVSFNNKLSTIWSAPNYCYRTGNVGAVLEISETHDKFYNTFVACPDSEREKPTYPTLKDYPDYYCV